MTEPQTPATVHVKREYGYSDPNYGDGDTVMKYNRCQCKHGDHDLDGKPDRCLNNAGNGHRVCANCRKP